MWLPQPFIDFCELCGLKIISHCLWKQIIFFRKANILNINSVFMLLMFRWWKLYLCYSFFLLDVPYTGGLSLRILDNNYIYLQKLVYQVLALKQFDLSLKGCPSFCHSYRCVGCIFLCISVVLKWVNQFLVNSRVQFSVWWRRIVSSNKIVSQTARST